MKKEIKNAQKIVEQLLKRRSDLITSREQEKIELVGKEDLTDIFSSLAFLANEKVESLKKILSRNTATTDELLSLNQELLEVSCNLKNIKNKYLNKMQLIERASGKKRVFIKNKKRVRIPEKLFKEYTSLNNGVLELDRMLKLIDTILGEDIKVTYKINDVSNLVDEDKLKYYLSLAALILCDEVKSPVNVSLNKDITVDADSYLTLIECFNKYKELSRLISKRTKVSKIKNNLKKKIQDVKDVFSSLFGHDKESGVNMALKKSVVAASLSLGVLSALASMGQDVTKSKEVACAITKEDEVAVFVSSKVKDFNIYNDSIIRDSSSIRNNISRISLVSDANTSIKQTTGSFGVGVDQIIRNANLSDLRAVGERVYKVAAITPEEEIPLDERVEENAYEIVAVVPVNEENMEENVEATDLLSTDTQSVESNLTVIQTPVTEITSNDGFIEFTDDFSTIESVTPVSAELANDEIIAGFHLTFNNTTYDFNEDEIKALYYVVLHECNGSYEDALVVVSIVVNRIEDPRYPDNVIDVLSAEGQFVVWDDVLKAISKYGDNFEMKEPIYNALYDCLYRGIRNNDYVEFKASWTSEYSTTGELKVQIAEDGNKCHNLAVSLDRTTEKEEILSDDAISDEVETSEQQKVLEIKL